MKKSDHSKTRAICQALLVTMLWSTSWILIKLTISQIPPLLFAGLRYSLASLFLLPVLLKSRHQIKEIKEDDWLLLISLGIVFYTCTQGGQFITLKYLATTTFSLILNFTTIIIALLGIIFLKENPTKIQWIGIIVLLSGVLLYFSRRTLGGEGWMGYAFAGFTVVSNAVASILGRRINRSGHITASLTTGISMSVGALLLLTLGLLIEDLPPLNLTHWIIIIGLASINTAFAFTLWNKSLQVLSAVESGILNNSMLVQIALLSWIFLGDTLSVRDWISLLIATFGMVLINMKMTSRSTRED